MSKIGILYLATGPYIAFWKKFFDSFEKHFMNDSELVYYLFSDSDDIYQMDNPRVKKYYLDPKPWPLITLLRFHTFLSIEEELRECEYLMFFNANMACERDIKEQEMLPQGDEDIFVVTHPAFYGKPSKYCPFERNKKSTAYIPYNVNTTYVQGAAFGGKTDAFLRMSKDIKNSIDSDLKNNYIARWHDESQLNRYIIGRKDIKILPPSYCYPYGINVSYEKVIYAVGKKEVFDIDQFKGVEVNYNDTIMKKIWSRVVRCMEKILANIFCVRDRIGHRK